MTDNRLMMKQQDLLELYQLLVLYQRTYQEYEEKSLSGWLDKISEHYQEKTGRDDIKKARNPRNAGRCFLSDHGAGDRRRKQYSASQDQEILVQYRNGDSFRHIASRNGCSVGYVQDVVKAEKKQMHRPVYVN